MLDWSKYITIANRYQRKAKAQDRENLNHTIILSLAQAQIRLDNNGGELSDLAMLRIASCRVADYWRSEYRNGRIISLNQVVYEDEDGNEVELIDTLAYDEATDLDAWLDNQTFILGCPKTLIRIVNKMDEGKPLTGYERLYLYRFRKREQKRLL